MTSTVVLAKLPTPLGDLVSQITLDGSTELGKTEKDKVEVAEWLNKIAQGDDLDSLLLSRTYLVGNYLTAADTALYGALHSVYSQLQAPQYFSYPALTRFFDHIQSRPQVRKAASALSPAFSVVTFDLENTPKAERKADPPKKKEKAIASNVSEEASSVPVTPRVKKGKEASAPAPAVEKSGKIAGGAAKVPKKEKKEKEKKTQEGTVDTGKKKAAGGNSSSSAADEGAGEPVPSMIDLRVGHIVDIEKHPDADSLYVEQIDFGEETGPRTVVSGLVNYIPIEEMRDRLLVGVCNLKPASMRGVKSFAMVLCATSKDGKEGGIELIRPPPDSKPGDKVYFEGPDFEDATPLSQLNPKKKIFETIQPGFTTLETKEAAWINPVTRSVHRIRTKNGVCAAPTLVGASLS
ncbi:uncharacterized protein FIBRA_03942 [Fibroporia radiculosa]|uniref:tRNA-binding domain-containing protein n=1 Tax=Fibroporia radiculosa TaxID=599839 RepID=J4I9W5_9APHY|nr:uncharacterized protein FIBRA_03942 [Fibroporia radiculosa]CCM01871.1 predicted protein [Fibroporia radiculosa]